MHVACYRISRQRLDLELQYTCSLKQFSTAGCCNYFPSNLTIGCTDNTWYFRIVSENITPMYQFGIFPNLETPFPRHYLYQQNTRNPNPSQIKRLVWLKISGKRVLAADWEALPDVRTCKAAGANTSDVISIKLRHRTFRSIASRQLRLPISDEVFSLLTISSLPKLQRAIIPNNRQLIH